LKLVLPGLPQLFNGAKFLVFSEKRQFYQLLLLYTEVVVLLSSTYERDGEKKNMAVTQFEPADARRCFPCWDEPACKVFAISLSLSLSFSLLADLQYYTSFHLLLKSFLYS
jgi:hypothetical protein